MFSFSKLHGFENVSLNTFSSPYVFETKLVKHCYIAISAINMFKVTLARLNPSFLWYWARSSSNEVPCQWNVIDKPTVILAKQYIWKKQLAANIVQVTHTGLLSNPR